MNSNYLFALHLSHFCGITANSLLKFGKDKEDLLPPCGPIDIPNGKVIQMSDYEMSWSNNNMSSLIDASGMPRVRMSGTDIRPKEVVLVCLALALLVFSVSLFFKHWRKNYWDINQLPYYAYLYKEDQDQNLRPPSQTEMIDQCPLSRTPSSRLLSRSRPSSFRTATSLDPISPTMNSSARTSLRLKSFKRNRASFIHVTAEAMHRQRSLRLHTNPWEYSRANSTSSARSSLKRHRRRTVPSSLRSGSTQSRALRTSFEEINCVKELDETLCCVELRPQETNIKKATSDVCTIKVEAECSHNGLFNEELMADTVI